VGSAALCLPLLPCSDHLGHSVVEVPRLVLLDKTFVRNWEEVRMRAINQWRADRNTRKWWGEGG
jgi:hypothetical protein